MIKWFKRQMQRYRRWKARRKLLKTAFAKTRHTIPGFCNSGKVEGDYILHDLHMDGFDGTTVPKMWSSRDTNTAHGKYGLITAKNEVRRGERRVH